MTLPESASLALRSLSVRLMREGRTAASAFTDTYSANGEQALTEYAWPEIEGGSLVAGQIYSNPPPWLDALRQGAPDLEGDLFSGGAGAALFVPVADRVCVVCFGYIHIALNDDAFERGFGLRVTLNTVPRGNLKTLDIATPDAVTFQKRVQASKESDIQDFGVDYIRDLAQVAGGKPSTEFEKFADFVAGKDSLSITCELKLEDVQSKCAEIVDIYRGNQYKKDYEWTDNLNRIQSNSTIEALDAELEIAISKLRDGYPSELHMSPPEIVKYEDGGRLHYNGFGSSGKEFSSLSITDYIAELNRCKFDGKISDIKDKQYISTIDLKSGKFKRAWKLYDCFNFEVEASVDGKIGNYVLFAGTWYLIKRSFIEEIEAFYAGVERVKIFEKTDEINERGLIKWITENKKGVMVVMDQDLVAPKGASYANIEACDFLSKSGEFIHLKDGHSSGPISHLWAQGAVSAETFVSDEKFRSSLRAKVKAKSKEIADVLPKSGDKVDRSKFKVVYGIMRKPYADGTLGLPFFSKVSMMGPIDRIRRLDLPVAIELIEKPAGEEEGEE